MKSLFKTAVFYAAHSPTKQLLFKTCQLVSPQTFPGALAFKKQVLPAINNAIFMKINVLYNFFRFSWPPGNATGPSGKVTGWFSKVISRPGKHAGLSGIATGRMGIVMGCFSKHTGAIHKCMGSSQRVIDFFPKATGKTGRVIGSFNRVMRKQYIVFH